MLSNSGGRRARALAEAEDLKRRMSRVGGYDIHGVEMGRGERALVLLHGLSGSSRWWERNLPELAAEYRVLVPDLIGFGLSRRRGLARAPLPDPGTVATLLVEWLDSHGVDRTHVIGHSMGGLVALHLASEHPARVDRLVLVDAAGIPRPTSVRALLRFAAEVAPLWRWGDPRFLPVIAADAAAAGPRTLLEAIRHVLRDDARPLLGSIEAPTLVIWGDRDTLVPLSHASELRAGIPGSRLVVLRGAAHNPMVDRPSDFNRLVLRFLDGETIGR